MAKIQLSDHFTYKKLIRYSIPMIGVLILTSIYGVVDGLFISNVEGDIAFSAVNLILPGVMMFSSIGFMMGSGGAAIVSKTLGEGKKEKASQYFSMIVYFLIIIGIVCAILGCILTKQISSLLGASEKMEKYCIEYGRVLFLFLPFMMLQYMFQSFFAVAEKPNVGLLITLCAGITNAIGDYLLIVVFRLGITGAAVASGASMVVGSVPAIIYFAFKKDLKFKLVPTKFDWKALGHTMSNGSSEMVTNISMSFVNMLYNAQLMKYYGENGVSAYGVIMYVGFIFSGCYMGVSQAVAPVVGYNYGASNEEELKNVFKKSLIILAVMAIFLTGSAEALSKPLAYVFFSHNEELLKLTTYAIRLYAIGYTISWINIFGSAFFTGLNNGLVSAIISFGRMLVFQLATIFILPLIFDSTGLWLAMPVSEVFSLIVTVTFFITMRKKYNYA